MGVYEIRSIRHDRYSFYIHCRAPVREEFHDVERNSKKKKRISENRNTTREFHGTAALEGPFENASFVCARIIRLYIDASVHGY